MSTPLPTPEATGTPSAGADGTAILHGPALALARAGWIGLTLALLGLDALGTPFMYRQLLTPCGTSVPCTEGIASMLTAPQLQALPTVGLSAPFYAGYITALQSLLTLMFVVVAAVIFWRRSESRVALLGAYALVCFGATFGGYRFGGTMATLPVVSPLWIVPVGAARLLSNVVFAAFFCLFPSGRWVPRWAPLIVVVGFVPSVAQEFFPASPLSQPQLPGFLLFDAEVLFLMVALVYRYRVVSTPAERRQTRWVVFGVAAGVAGFLTLIGPLYTILSAHDTPAQADNPLSSLIGTTAVNVLIMFIPVSIGVAILRSHLWDIDIIIRRTLIYGTLTAVLGSVYFACVIAFQATAQALTGRSGLPAWLIVASTLLIAALFTPLRRRIQATIDRRFYRRKYDATRTLSAFAATLRTETDLEQLTGHLVAVVQETMQPAHVSLWLRVPERRGGESGVPESAMRR